MTYRALPPSEQEMRDFRDEQRICQQIMAEARRMILQRAIPTLVVVDGNIIEERLDENTIERLEDLKIMENSLIDGLAKKAEKIGLVVHRHNNQ